MTIGESSDIPSQATAQSERRAVLSVYPTTPSSHPIGS
jgi:hypothetical protein